MTSTHRLPKILLVLLLFPFSLGAQAVPTTHSFEQLAAEPTLRSQVENQISQEFNDWQRQGRPAAPVLYQQVRHFFNFYPRQPKWRKAFQDMLRAQEQRPSMPAQQAELYYSKQQVLNYDQVEIQQTLARLLFQKHGAVPIAQLKKAYGILNQAFDLWDAQSYPLALKRFREVQSLAKMSPEFATILAIHLRDQGQLNEAKAVLSPFLQAPNPYLRMLPELWQDIEQAQSMAKSTIPVQQIPGLVGTGQLDRAQQLLSGLSTTPTRYLWQARVAEKRGRYHQAAADYMSYYNEEWRSRYPHLIPVVYKAQLEDVNSIDLIALKFRTSPELIQQINGRPHPWIETYRMLIIPVVRHQFQWPAYGYVSSHFGYRLHPLSGTWKLHQGVDIETLTHKPAHAVSPGTVLLSGYDSECGNMVNLQHVGNINTIYCHGHQRLVQNQQKVNAGQQILLTGNTGASASNHLHFGVKVQGQFVDPLDWI